MGCDIHIIAEVKENGVWKKNTNKVFLNPYYEMYKGIKVTDPARYKEIKKGNWIDLKKFMDEPSSGRNYNWFAVLADVRNGRGFAGIKTGEGFDPIADPKGFPSDASRETMEFLGMVIDDNMTMDDYKENGGEIDLGNGDYKYVYPRLKIIDWGCKYLDEEETIAENVDYHSYSYFTAKELAEFDWKGKMTMLRGTISLEQYKSLQEKGGEPTEGWCGASWGKGFVTVDEDQADKILKDGVEGTEFEGKTIKVNYHWMDGYHKMFEHELKTIVEPLKKLSMKYEDARIVFAFDN